MNRLIYCYLLMLSILPSIGNAQSSIASLPPNLFESKPMVAPHIHVEILPQFVKWGGKPIAQGEYDPAYYVRTRLGTVTFSPDFRIYIDVIKDTVHWPSYYELLDAQSGVVLGKYSVLSPEDAEWYFAGNGYAYLNQTHLSLCGPRYTKKIVQRSKALVEVTQPLVYVGAETEVLQTTPLFEAPNSKKVVATLVAGTKVMVVGVQSAEWDALKMAFLVKTPYGLTGWHLPRGHEEDGALSIYQCN